MISVIVPAKDASKTIGECLQSLMHQDGLEYNSDYEVIVVDDGSIDQTAEIAQQPGIRVIRQSNLGPAAARNAGARNARGALLAFTDADCAPTHCWLKELIQPFQKPEVVGVKGTYCTNQTNMVSRFVQLEYENKYARMSKYVTIDFIDTYSAAYRKDIFVHNGGFNETLRYLEDQELSFRLSRKGYRLVFEPKAKVLHYHDRNIKEYIQRKFDIGYWKAFILRWIPEKAFKDSHTTPTQRVEIILSALLLGCIPFLIFWPDYASIALLTCGFLFLVITSPFLRFIGKRDWKILWIALGMVLIRAWALGFGLLKGFLLAPKVKQKEYPCLTIGARSIKRMVDIAGGGIGLILSAPLMALAAVAIRLDSQGPIFYKQARAGENGRPFTLFKLRTMVDGADQMVKDVIHKSQLKGPVFKIPDDPRVTKVGRYLRRWGLDEIPQFWNILKGEMSLVGPRPEEVQIVELYNDYERQRLMIKPGLTGPMQVNGRGNLDFDTRLQMELSYMRNYTLLEDIKIILKTIPAIISQEGAF